MSETSPIPEKTNGKNVAVLWIVISVVVLGATGTAAYFLYFKKKKA